MNELGVKTSWIATVLLKEEKSSRRCLDTDRWKCWCMRLRERDEEETNGMTPFDPTSSSTDSTR